MFGREFEFIALLGERGQLVVGAKIFGSQLKGTFPAQDALFERSIDISEGPPRQ